MAKKTYVKLADGAGLHLDGKDKVVGVNGYSGIEAREVRHLKIGDYVSLETPLIDGQVPSVIKRLAQVTGLEVVEDAEIVSN